MIDTLHTPAVPTYTRGKDADRGSIGTRRGGSAGVFLLKEVIVLGLD